MSEATTTNESVLGAGSSSSEAQGDWRTDLPADIREDPSLQDIQDVNNLAKSYVNAQRMIGKNRVALPAENSTSEEWGQFYDSLGRPKEATSYDFGPRPTLADGMIYDEAMEAKYRDLAHKSGLSNDQAKQLYSDWNALMSEQHENTQRDVAMQRETWLKDLKQEFGQAYNERVDLAQRAVRHFGGDEMTKWFDETGQGDNPLFIKMFATMGEYIAEGRAEKPAQRGFIMTPEQARHEIEKLQQDNSFMQRYQGPAIHGHKDAVQQMQQLFDLAYPTEGE